MVSKCLLCSLLHCQYCGEGRAKVQENLILQETLTLLKAMQFESLNKSSLFIQTLSACVPGTGEHWGYRSD